MKWILSILRQMERILIQSISATHRVPIVIFLWLPILDEYHKIQWKYLFILLVGHPLSQWNRYSIFYLIFSNRKTCPVIWGITLNDLDKLTICLDILNFNYNIYPAMLLDSIIYPLHELKLPTKSSFFDFSSQIYYAYTCWQQN